MTIVREDEFIDEATVLYLKEYVETYSHAREVRYIIDSSRFEIRIHGYKNSRTISGNVSCNLNPPVSLCCFLCGPYAPVDLVIPELFYRPVLEAVIAVAKRQVEHKGGK